jgi:hypothetical protein
MHQMDFNSLSSKLEHFDEQQLKQDHPFLSERAQ